MPSTQVWVVAQATPQTPQCWPSVLSSTHRSSQTTCAPGQAQTPFWQVRPPPQATHAAPAVPHAASSVPVWQVDPSQQPAHFAPSQEQAPLRQLCPATQRLPQRPQLLGSVAVATHALPHLTVPALHFFFFFSAWILPDRWLLSPSVSAL